MGEVRWTLQAADDLEGITEFIARDSPHYASLFVIDVLQAVDRLAQMPRIGRIVPEIKDVAIREIPLGNYRIIYRLRDDVAEILTVYHGARLFDSSKLE
jgi:toxin ParE1/3/4